MPAGYESWEESQLEYEIYHEKSVQSDAYQEYLDEIDSVREIYMQEFHLDGDVLDIGGHQGRLRHFLGDDVGQYVSVDPYVNIFSGISLQPQLLRAYPVLSDPCNFISAHAEYLPFRSESFDWIHMRSVVDHFADPFLAFVEANRCTKAGGKLLVGLTILERKHELDRLAANNTNNSTQNSVSLSAKATNKLRQEGIGGLSSAVVRRLRSSLIADLQVATTDDHMFRFSLDTLNDLFARTGWTIIKEHWQKPPFDFCIYACGQKGHSLDQGKDAELT